MAPTVRCIESYREGEAVFLAGKSYDFREEEAARLMRGAPSAWEVVEGTVRVGGPDEYVDYRDPSAVPRKQTRKAPHGPAGHGAVTASRSAPQDTFGEDDEVGDVDLDAMGVPELRRFAAAQAIGLTGLRAKVDIRNAIERELALREAGGVAGEEPAADEPDDGDDGDAAAEGDQAEVERECPVEGCSFNADHEGDHSFDVDSDEAD